MSETVRIAFRVDEELKTEAEKVLGQMGMSMTSALNMFLAQCVREQRLPFRPGATKEEMEDNYFDNMLDRANEILRGEGGILEHTINLHGITFEEQDMPEGSDGPDMPEGFGGISGLPMLG